MYSALVANEKGVALEQVWCKVCGTHALPLGLDYCVSFVVEAAELCQSINQVINQSMIQVIIQASN